LTQFHSDSNSFRVALAQINSVLGDLQGNADLIYTAAQEAHLQGASLIITPELSLTGYPPEDLLLRPSFITACQQTLDELCQRLAHFNECTVIVGHPKNTVLGLQNCASVLSQGKILACYAKQVLPNHEVFDEKRYFVPGNAACVFQHHNQSIGILLCEDIWHDGPAQQAKQAGAELLIVMNASPYHVQKVNLRLEILRKQILQTQLPLLYINAVGGQDELVFDGGSCALNHKGVLCALSPQFKKDLGLVAIQDKQPQVGSIANESSIEAQVYEALVLGVHDYVEKNRFPGVIIGLSGGVDSALVLAIAVDAIGADRVRAVMMPSPYTAEISWLDARQLADNLGVQYDEIPINETVNAFENTLAPQFKNRGPDTTEENIQARVRGTLLMALSNKSGRLVLTTGNKSEMAVGYCTLYGDMAGGFAVIKDISKTLVYQLCHYRNQVDTPYGKGAVIPNRILTRAPSAELRANQTDQDSLPDYEILDGILARYMEENQSSEEIIQAGFDPHSVEKVTRLIKLNEYKRRQAPPGVRITQRAFGRDWRYPITSRFKA